MALNASARRHPIPRGNSMNKLLRTLMLSALILVSLPTLANTQCTQAPSSEWLGEEEMRARITDMGYGIKEFKITDGGCYEIYGWDEQGHRVEIYFNPVDASIVKQNIDD